MSVDASTEEKKTTWTAGRTTKWLVGAFLTLGNAWAAAITIAEKHGEELTGFAAWTAESAYWIFPVGMFALGAFAGWQLKRLFMRQEGVTAEGVKALKEKVAVFEERYDEERLAAEKAEAKERARLAMSRDEFVREPSGEKKAMAAALYLMDGHRFCGRENLERDVEALSLETYYLEGELCFFVFDKRGGDCMIMRLESWLEAMFDAFPDMATEFPDDALEEARETMFRWSL